MTVALRCLTYAIGLSQTDCECLAYPISATRSDSGYYLDELRPLSSFIIDQRGDCEVGDLYNLMFNSRDEGIKGFNTDLMRELLKTNKLKRPVFNGTVGRRIWENPLGLSGTYAVLRMPVVDVVSGTALITNIGTMFAETADFEITIYNSLGDLIDVIPVSSIANKFTSNIISLNLPLHMPGTENLEYYFVYPLAGHTPLDNILNCRNCSCPYSFNLKKPYWTMTPLQDGWEKWAMFRGCTLNELDFMCLDSCSTNSCDMLGLSLDIKFSCNITETICLGDGDTTGIDFNSDVDGLQIAQAIRLKSGISLIFAILAAPKINRYTLANRETLIAAKEAFIEEYDIIIEALAKTLDIHKNNDCLECHDSNDMRKVLILS